MKKALIIGGICIIGFGAIINFSDTTRAPATPAAPTPFASYADAKTLHTPAQNAEEDKFGSAVATNGTYVIVGASGEVASNRHLSGAAYLYDATTGALVYRFNNPAEGSFADFGAAVVINDRYALIGAPYAQDQFGAGYLYDLESGDLLHTFFNPAAKKSATFGWHVGLSGDRAMVGTSSGPEDYAAAFIFDLNDPDRTVPVAFPGKVGDAPVMPISAFGDDYVAFARMFKSQGTGFADRAHIVVFDACNGRQIRSVENPYPDDLSFGRGLALHGEKLLIGVPAVDTDVPGSAMLLDLTTGEQIATYIGVETDTAMHFGTKLAFNDNHAVIGSDYINADQIDRRETGEVSVLDLQTGEVVFHETLAKENPRWPFNLLTVAISETDFVVGDILDDRTALDAGVAYVKPLPVAVITPDASPARDSANCNAVFAQAAQSATALAQATIIANAAQAEQDAIDAEIAAAIEATRPLTHYERVSALSMGTFNMERAGRVIEESDLSALDKSRLLINLVNANANKPTLPDTLDQIRAELFR